MRALFTKDNLPLTSFLALVAIGLLQLAAYVFDWHLPWSPYSGLTAVSLAYIALFLWIYRVRPRLRIAVATFLGRPATWLALFATISFVWLAFLTWAVASSATSLSILWAAMPAPPSSQLAAVETPPQTTEPPPPTITPIPYLRDDFTSQRVNRSTWQAALCPPGSLQFLTDRVRIMLDPAPGDPQTSCVLEARLRGATVSRAELRLTVGDDTNNLGYAGIVASCGGSIANFLLTGSELQISRSAAPVSQLLFLPSLPATKTLVVEWREGSMKFTALEDNVSQELPCSSRTQYIRIGAIAASGGVVKADLLDFNLWAMTATPTP